MKLRVYQEGAVQAAMEAIKAGVNGIIKAPTGTGKSVIIAELCKRAVIQWPGCRLMMLTHSKELIAQNHAKVRAIWPQAPSGIYSAGLKSRNTVQPIIFAGIQSAIKNLDAFGIRNVLIVDECHMISPKQATSYHKLITHFRNLFPQLVVIGLTATDFRMSMGSLTGQNDSMFDRVIFDACSIKAFEWFIAEKYLAPLVTKRTVTQIDMSGVRVVNGDYVESEAAEKVSSVLQAAIEETIHLSVDRRKWLVFASSVDNCDRIAAAFRNRGVSAASVHSKIPAKERDRIINAHRSGEFTALVNQNMLTTGYDDPDIDLIVMLRATASSGLWVQMLGRGTRPSEGKDNCLVLDYANNTERLGPINDPVIPKRPGQGGGEAPVRVCPECQVYHHASVRSCDLCGYIFPIWEKTTDEASNEDVMITKANETIELEVADVLMTPYQGPNSLVLKVQYMTKTPVKYNITEWVPIEARGDVAMGIARDWWYKRTEHRPVPRSCDDVLRLKTVLTHPTHVVVKARGKDRGKVIVTLWKQA